MKHHVLFLVALLLLMCALTGVAQTGLKLTEIQYDVPTTNGDTNGDGTRQSAGDEFVELYNSSNASIDLSGYVIIEREKQVVFTFPVGSILPAKQFAVVFGNAVTGTWGSAFPAGTLKFSHYTGTTNRGFGPVTTSTGSTKSNLASNGDRVMIVDPILADTVAEVAYGRSVDSTIVIPLWSKGTYLAGENTVNGDTIAGSINQSIHLQTSSGKWGRHKEVAQDTSISNSPGFLSDVVTGVENEVSGVTPATFALRQNYPNPFNPSTTITFSLEREAFVTLKVHDINGKDVAIVLQKQLGGGVFFVPFDATALPAGVYFYTLQAGQHSVTKQMVLLK